MTVDPLALMTDVEEATQRVLRAAASLDDDAVTAPSGLSGWTRGHVLTHLARQADAITNLLTWARTGVETPAYASPAARVEGIEAGAERPLAEQLTDLRTSHERMADAAAAMPADCWTFHIPSRNQLAAALPWVRLREVEVHHVDLAVGYTPADWSDAFAQRLLREIVGGAAPAAPAMALRPFGLDHELILGDPGAAPTPVIGGPTRSIAAWLSGRGDGADLTVSPDGELPIPATWM
ncbi:maleylpyruvate isomerase family mycothiol-dependent enzyme [Krasilnikovia sp. MM14-A1259]|uniref:maleylpyruvate isomerase family mycothiol-dependent enzyme n=1 Tax=Krasilnikovia sp. MM14-A1259 TaxID=3373539 RepID=UPI00399D4F80